MEHLQRVIIVGAARSGTKFLRDILAASPITATVPNDVNYVWRYGNEARVDDELLPDDATPSVIRFIGSTLPRLARFDPERHRALVEKTVSNGLRLGFVNRIFPDARFVFLVRDGRAVTESAMRMWRGAPEWPNLWSKLSTMPLRNYPYAAWYAGNFVKGLLAGRRGGRVWGPRYSGIDADLSVRSLAYVCARQWSRTVDRAADDLASIPQDRVFSLRYEELVESEARILALLRWLDWPMEEPLAAYRARVVHGLDTRWSNALGADEKRDVLEAAGKTLRRFGYIDADMEAY